MSNKPKPGTPAYYDKKWSPLTEGIKGRDSVYTAWVMENEAKHLSSSRNDEERISGVTLRFVFPSLRRAVPELIDGELNFKRVYQCLEDALYSCYLETFVDSDYNYRIPEYIPSSMDTTKLTLGLAERTKAAIESLRNIL